MFHGLQICPPRSRYYCLVQCNIWTFCNPETGDGCDNTCDPNVYNYNPSNPTDPLRFGQSSSGCLPGNQWPK